jgi:hypothetical protein
MPQSNYDHASSFTSSALDDESCPKCGTEMEPIENVVEGLPVQQLRLCPSCYLVTWRDENGFQSRQGVPMKPGSDVDGKTIQ